MNIAGHDIAVCSWSLKPAGMADLVGRVRQLGLSHIQLAVGGLLAMDESSCAAELDVLRKSGLKITAAMIGFPGEDYSSIDSIRMTGGFVPNEPWPARKALTLAAAKLASELGITRLTTHIGFVPPSSDDSYDTIVARVREITDNLGHLGVQFGMETGQEPASDLLQFLNDLPARTLFVNFDPANMILYGCGDPIAAIQTLGRHIGHVHVKDAVASKIPGTQWGNEVPFGTGQVGPAKFLAALAQVGYTGPLAIEREAGDKRMQEASIAIEALKSAAANV